MNETLGALAFLKTYSYVMHGRVISNANDVFLAYISDFRPGDLSEEAQYQRETLPIELKRLYHLFDRTLNINNQKTYQKDEDVKRDLHIFLQFINDNAFMIQLSQNKVDNDTLA